jgi:hypothetical protein
LKKVEHENMLNIQSLVVRSPPHSASSSQCVEGKTYNENMQFVQMIIHDICKTRTSIVEFFCKSKRSWHARESTGPKVTSVNPIFIEVWSITLWKNR